MMTRFAGGCAAAMIKAGSQKSISLASLLQAEKLDTHSPRIDMAKFHYARWDVHF
jgi:hypothetical protein